MPHVEAGATGVTPSTGNTTPTGNGEVEVTSSGSGTCPTTPAAAIVVTPEFTG